MFYQLPFPITFKIQRYWFAARYFVFLLSVKEPSFFLKTLSPPLIVSATILMLQFFMSESLFCICFDLLLLGFVVAWIHTFPRQHINQKRWAINRCSNLTVSLQRDMSIKRALAVHENRLDGWYRQTLPADSAGICRALVLRLWTMQSGKEVGCLCNGFLDWRRQRTKRWTSRHVVHLHFVRNASFANHGPTQKGLHWLFCGILQCYFVVCSLDHCQVSMKRDIFFYGSK